MRSLKPPNFVLVFEKFETTFHNQGYNTMWIIQMQNQRFKMKQKKRKGIPWELFKCKIKDSKKNKRREKGLGFSHTNWKRKEWNTKHKKENNIVLKAKIGKRLPLQINTFTLIVLTTEPTINLLLIMQIAND